LHEIAGLQFIFDSRALSTDLQLKPTPLEVKHVDEMIALAKLTKPGPFSRRTIEFGHYHGFFADGRLVAMTGQRLHPNDFSEISAVCTHPDHLGKGYAATLIQQQLNIISRTNATPFLHVRADNARAIRIYERLGFRENGPMYFYFMKRKA
jgi:predicted GNAT family acetyltransferase